MSAGCLICASGGLKPHLAGFKDPIGRSKETYSFLICPSCGSFSADPVPSADAIGDLYPGQYTFRRSQARFRGERIVQEVFWWGYHRWTYTSDARAVMRMSRLRGGRLLDAGCGSGIHLRLFQSAGFDVEGVEISADDCAFVRKALGCPVHQGTLKTVRLPAGAFDIVTMFNALEHLPDPREYAAVVRTLLKPGGWFIAKIPMADGLQAKLLGRRWRNIREIPRHLGLASTRGMARLLEDSGFTDVRHMPASLFENACMFGTSFYPLSIPYINEALAASRPARLFNTAAGALLTYLSLPEAVLESIAGCPSTAIFAARKAGS